MDLVTSIASETNIPIIRKDQKIWFFRTKGGKFYYDFITNNFIALGWDIIPSSLITDEQKSREVKKAQIEKAYPEEKRPGLIFGQLDVFYNRMHVGDLVLIPDEGTKTVAIGKIGELAENIRRKTNVGEHEQCAFLHRRTVEWKRKIDVAQDVFLFKVLRAQQTISDVTDEATLVFRNLFPVYISGDFIHLTFQKETVENLSLSSNVDLLSNLIQITDAAAELYGRESIKKDLTMKTAVGSPGFLEVILPYNPVAVVSVSAILLMIRTFIGKEKNSDGTSATGLIALITKINELINDHQTRKKTDAEIRQIDANTKLIEAQTEKTLAEAALIKSETAKANAEARRIELENEQIAWLPSGKTTVEARSEGEQLVVPSPEAITKCARVFENCGGKICAAAKENGLSFGGEEIEKVG